MGCLASSLHALYIIYLLVIPLCVNPVSDVGDALVDLDEVGLSISIGRRLSSSLTSNSEKHTVQPMAVTSAPAPAPWMTKGRGE